MLTGLVAATRCRSAFRALLAAHSAAQGQDVSPEDFVGALEAAGYAMDEDLMVYGLMPECDFLAALESEGHEHWHSRFCLEPHFEPLDGRLICVNCHPQDSEDIRIRINQLANLQWKRPQYVGLKGTPLKLREAY
jgi:hypothetical protein